MLMVERVYIITIKYSKCINNQLIFLFHKEKMILQCIIVVQYSSSVYSLYTVQNYCSIGI